MKELRGLLEGIASAKYKAEKSISVCMVEFVIEQEFEKLQEQNKTLKEALEFVVKESGLSTNYNKVAREALKKAEEL